MVSYSIIIPCFNDSARLVRNAFLLSKYVKSRRDVEVVVVDDGSCDEDREKLAACCTWCDFRLVRYPVNRGKWFAVRQGVSVASKTHVVLADADLSVAPWQTIRAYEEQCVSSDVMVGDRNRFQVGIPSYRRWVGWCFNQYVRFVMRSHVFWGLSDTQCPSKVFPRFPFLWGKLRVDGFAGDVELIAAYDAFGYDVRRVDVVYVNDRRSKVRLSDVFVMAGDVWRIRGRRF